ncbi:hypothetical protein FD755_018332, partial [Muntiacus reevesi]
AKDKLREQNSRHVLHTVNQESFQVKDKAKLATTDLKERNTVNDEKVNSEESFCGYTKGSYTHVSKGLSLEPLQKQLIPQQGHESKPVNVDEATSLTVQV